MDGLNMKKGESYKIKGFTDDEIANKLLILGFLPGSTISLQRKSPFSGTLYVNIDGNRMALRKNEAAAIIVDK